jgi:transporter family-2 protein
MRLDLLAALSGALISLQSRANGELSHRLNNGLEAALISFGSGLIVLLVISLFIPGIKDGVRKLSSAARKGDLPKNRLFAGVLGATFVAVQTQMVPLLGVAVFSVASIAGQTAASLGVDRLGLTGGGKKHITVRRVCAAIVTVLAVLISAWDRIDAKNLSFISVIIAGVAGGIVGIQRAFNGQINEHSGQSFTTSLLNFFMGTSALFLVLVLGVLVHRTHFTSLPYGPWWIYTGGTIGVFYVAFTSTIVQHLGVLTFTLFSIGGQLVGALIIDVVIPTHGVNVSWYLVGGIVMTYVGVVVGGSGQSRLARK